MNAPFFFIALQLIHPGSQLVPDIDDQFEQYGGSGHIQRRRYELLRQNGFFTVSLQPGDRNQQVVTELLFFGFDKKLQHVEKSFHLGIGPILVACPGSLRDPPL